jgi:hypothetical protein
MADILCPEPAVPGIDIQGAEFLLSGQLRAITLSIINIQALFATCKVIKRFTCCVQVTTGFVSSTADTLNRLLATSLLLPGFFVSVLLCCIVNSKA